MNCTCNIEQRRLTPGVFNLKQHLNDAETMVWKLTSRLTNNGELDLCDYDAFLVLSVNGVIDEIMLTKTMIDDNGDGEAPRLDRIRSKPHPRRCMYHCHEQANYISWQNVCYRENNTA